MTEHVHDEQARFDQGLLFTDGLPELDVAAGYRGAVAARAAGITYRQLDYWARTGLVEPTVRGAAGSGSQRLYGFRDILVLKLVKRLLDTGISLQQIRTAVEPASRVGRQRPGSDHPHERWRERSTCARRTTRSSTSSARGQGVFGIAVGKVLREVESSLVELDATDGRRPACDELAARRAARTRQLGAPAPLTTAGSRRDGVRPIALASSSTPRDETARLRLSSVVLGPPRQPNPRVLRT